MSDDLVKRARDDAFLSRLTDAAHEVPRAELMEALADELDRLRAENERLREALERVDRCATYPVCTTINPRGYDVRPPNKELVELIAEIVRAALKAKGDE